MPGYCGGPLGWRCEGWDDRPRSGDPLAVRDLPKSLVMRSGSELSPDT